MILSRCDQILSSLSEFSNSHTVKGSRILNSAEDTKTLNDWCCKKVSAKPCSYNEQGRHGDSFQETEGMGIIMNKCVKDCEGGEEVLIYHGHGQSDLA